MKKQTARLLLFVLFSVLLGSSVIASRPLTPTQDCKESCGQKRTVALQRCERMSGDARTNCQNAANEQYNKCVQACDGGMGGNTGKP